MLEMVFRVTNITKMEVNSFSVLVWNPMEERCYPPRSQRRLNGRNMPSKQKQSRNYVILSAKKFY